MYKNKSICIVIPAYNEEKLIGRVISTLPDWVDWIVAIDDKSQDKTSQVVESYRDKLGDKLILIRHTENQGVGGTTISGFKWARDHNIDIAVVMAGDAQMSPTDLPAILDPVASGEADYAKGNRLFAGDAWNSIPKVRYLGNSMLSMLTKIASGYWHVADSQTGYLAINLRMLQLINWDKTHKRYGCPNDYLVRLNIYNARVRDVPIKPIYEPGRKSGIRYSQFIPKTCWLLLKLFLWRMIVKYIIRDFHPLVLFYAWSAFTGLISLGLLVRLIVLWIANGYIPETTALGAALFMIISMQFGLFAMWFDSEQNKDLRA